MGRLKQFEPLVIKDFEESIFHLPVHGHTYYEMIFIYSGSGNHVLNDNQIPYQAGDLFLISPDDEHIFQIDKLTRFVLIKFTDSYFKQQHHNLTDDTFSIIPASIMRQKLLKEVKLQFEEPYKTLLRNAIDSILLYDSMKVSALSPYIYQQILSIFGLIKEVVLKLDDRIDKGIPNKETLISYIHEHIYDPRKYEVKQIASHFNISANYFGDYFKRNFQISYRDYIKQYRNKLLEKRINSGHFSLKQIAIEFGFTDESHLSNYFKNHYNLRPTEYRKQASA